MSTPPRRRQSPNRRTPPESGGGWLPTVALGLGVIVAGLGIGALVAVLMQRGGGKDAAPAVATASPFAVTTPVRAPVAIATIEPPHRFTPTPQPTPAPSPASTPSSAPTATLTPAPRPSPAPTTIAATAVPTTIAATVAPTALARPAATPVRVALVTPAPLVSVQPEATAAPTTTTAAAAVSGYDERASGIVRRYLDALIRGDEKTALTTLAAGAGTLSEQAFLDPNARIVSVKVTRIDASNASVGCEISAAKGHYYATYHVTAAAGGPVISEHDYIKV